MGSLEFASLSPASNMRQRVKCSTGDAPTVSLNLRAKVDRDMPAPPDAAFQPFRQMQPERLDQHQVGEVLRDQKASRLTTPVPRESDS
jgi:hypothetical protein